jgi:hypothetical protein
LINAIKYFSYSLNLKVVVSVYHSLSLDAGIKKLENNNCYEMRPIISIIMLS